jgi:hypothetical protein
MRTMMAVIDMNEMNPASLSKKILNAACNKPPTSQIFPANLCVASQLSSLSKVHGSLNPAK